MLKIDAHQHFWKYDPSEYSWIGGGMPQLKQDFLAEDLEPILLNQGFSGSVAVQARQTLEENEFLLKQAEQSELVKGVVGWVDLLSYEITEHLDKYAATKWMKGFRHILQDEKDPKFMLDWRFIDGVKILDLYDFTYDLLIYEQQMPVAIKFLDKLNGSTKIVLDHIGKPRIKERLTNNWKDSLKELANYPNLSIKVSGLVTEAQWNNWNNDTFKPYLDLVVETFGIERIMVGSDWPVCLLSAKSHQEVIDIANSYFNEFSEEDQSLVFGENCSRFYNL